MIAPIVRSMRLRTLPLSLAGVVCGVFLAVYDVQAGRLPGLNWWVLPLLFLTTVCLQILCNMSNELGDHLSGTDGAGREGPMYSLGQGAIDVKTIKRVINFFVVLCCLFGAAMVWVSFGTLFCWRAVALLLLGAFAIWASLHYTLGKNPYGYKGLGDLFVFIFFGLVSVLGGYYMVAWESFRIGNGLLVAIGIGLFSVAVLNVNNIRDMESDADTRVTVPLKIGARRAKIYHTLLIVGGWLCFVLFSVNMLLSGEQTGRCWWLYLLTLPLYVLHLSGVWKREGKALDPMLPLLVMSTFALSILFGLGLIL